MGHVACTIPLWKLGCELQMLYLFYVKLTLLRIFSTVIIGLTQGTMGRGSEDKNLGLPLQGINVFK